MERINGEILDQVRSWGITYDGRTNPLEFIRKLEGWATGYGIGHDQLVQTMPFILEDAASDWWNCTPNKLDSWEKVTGELVEYFLPRRYQEQLKEQIQHRRQGETEPTRGFAMELMQMMRFAEYTAEEKLNRIYLNCRSQIKLYTRRSGFKTLPEFLKLAEVVEMIEAESFDQPQHRLDQEICRESDGGPVKRDPKTIGCCETAWNRSEHTGQAVSDQWNTPGSGEAKVYIRSAARKEGTEELEESDMVIQQDLEEESRQEEGGSTTALAGEIRRMAEQVEEHPHGQEDEDQEEEMLEDQMRADVEKKDADQGEEPADLRERQQDREPEQRPQGNGQGLYELDGRKVKIVERINEEILDQVRSWGITYDGRTNPLEFIRKLEGWATGYGIGHDQLVQTMPFILEDAASDWWNCTPNKLDSWEKVTGELVEYFLPRRYQEQLKEQIQHRRQGETEPTRGFAMELMQMMRFAEYTAEEKLNRIYLNCRSQIKLYTRRSGFKTLPEFLKLAEVVEMIEAESFDQPQHRLDQEICRESDGGPVKRDPKTIGCCETAWNRSEHTGQAVSDQWNTPGSGEAKVYIRSAARKEGTEELEESDMVIQQDLEEESRQEEGGSTTALAGEIRRMAEQVEEHPHGQEDEDQEEEMLEDQMRADVEKKDADQGEEPVQEADNFARTTAGRASWKRDDMIFATLNEKRRYCATVDLAFLNPYWESESPPAATIALSSLEQIGYSSTLLAPSIRHMGLK
ncbi:trichohyalin-like [Drosophila kikkawai]|uniref:Trichohyalin-like n=1 Tax=Drosophila kikkawai TaxID=30033 RepID=A0ABM4GLI9_DROKI